MAITVAKVTYSLKPETVHRVQELALSWGVPKSEVIRRAVDNAMTKEITIPRLTPLQALEELMKKPCISPAEAKRWEREVRLARRASGRKRGAEIDREWRRVEKNSTSSGSGVRPKAGKVGHA